ncbi:MAG: hypothetical protein GY896_23030 [Gammaproteobacteria bacterium]|nr:hypothetical protein [Gammaproteobacteria bacterium]
MKTLVLFFSFLLVPCFLIAQEGEVAQVVGINWQQLVALLITAVLVPFVVEFLKRWLPTASPNIKRILALVAGPALMALGTFLSGLLGYPIDFQSIIDIITAGIMASIPSMATYGVAKRHAKRKLKLAA